jgi:hypothetical protein
MTTDPQQTVLRFERATQAYAEQNQLAWPSNYGFEQLDTILNARAAEVADAGGDIYDVRCGDKDRPGLVTIDDSGLTVYRLGDESLETFLFGHLTGGYMAEIRALPDDPADRPTDWLTYANEALGPIGGFFAIDMRYVGEEETLHARAVLSALTGSR